MRDSFKPVKITLLYLGAVLSTVKEKQFRAWLLIASNYKVEKMRWAAAYFSLSIVEIEFGIGWVM